MCGGGGGGGGESKKDKRERKKREKELDKQNKKLFKQNERFAAEQKRLAAIPATQPRQSMQYSLLAPAQSGEFAAPINPGTGTNDIFDINVTPPTLFSNNVKPTVKTIKSERGRRRSRGGQLTIDRNSGIGTAKKKKSSVGLNIPT